MYNGTWKKCRSKKEKSDSILKPNQKMARHTRTIWDAETERKCHTRGVDVVDDKKQNCIWKGNGIKQTDSRRCSNGIRLKYSCP